MKIGARTRQILKNFAAINQNILIRPGNLIRTLNQSRTSYAEATIEEEFPSEFGIYDLNEFLGVLNLFSDPELNFQGNTVSIMEGKNSVQYSASDESGLVYPKKDRVQYDVSSQFVIEPESLQAVLKASGVLKVDFVTFKSDGTELVLIVHDKDNKNSNQFKIDLGSSNVVFEFHIKTEYLTKMLIEKYTVDVIGPRKIMFFNGDQKLYMFGASDDSTFEG